MEDFESRQKTICIPLFELPCEEIQFYDFRNRPVLPFLSYESRKVGGYGTVRKARIHEAHYSHIQDCKTRNRTLREFAIKELHTESKEAYDQEMELFRKIGARSESESPRHLIQLQFSYLYGDRYFLVFPWADGNLREFWAKHHDYHLRKDKDIVWFFHASKADFKVALGNLTHGKLKRWGRHGDIKPENILWFEKYDEMEDFLVISDFGLTSFNTTTSRSILKQDKFFIIEESSESSPKLEAKIKPSVQEWIIRLRKHETCTEELRDFLSFVECSMLRPIAKERPDCGLIMTEISKLLDTCQLKFGSNTQDENDTWGVTRLQVQSAQRLYLAHVDVKRWR
ncbi:hypothetical protein CGCF413_v011049 [Colletotrichum fructicola]|nr:hypothetical protein CGCF413_v011049 [Colletotrichum fructicola]